MSSQPEKKTREKLKKVKLCPTRRSIEDEDEDEEFCDDELIDDEMRMDIAGLMTSLLATPDGDTVCSAS